MDKISGIARSHPQGKEDTNHIEALTKSIICSSTCYTCADACLASESPKEMEDCIRTCLDCAALCESATRLLASPSSSKFPYFREAIEACAAACEACAQECSHHVEMHEHCKLCEEACRDCMQACEVVINS